jgi:small-conductance mechanosensitive channel
MDLSKVGVLAGAFGGGIGFGLQGEVRRIGIRASTVRTYQGADIIVPNSQFITANVTNWTISDQMRRIERLKYDATDVG